MTRFFERGTTLAEMERQMMMSPNFTPRGNGSAVLCRYRSAAADVDCRSCVLRRRQSCRSLSGISALSPRPALTEHPCGGRAHYMNVYGSGAVGCFCLPMPARQLQRIQMLAENLELFDFVPGVHSSEEYGRYMIQQSGRFEYDENLAFP